MDQHYNTLRLDSSPFESICKIMPTWPQTEVRKHLATFLFRKNEEVNCPVSQLSGGEKARLAFAQIAAKTPQLLILDEIGNNLDLETRQHVIQVLRGFPGAMILISHDTDFLKQVGVCDCYTMNDSSISYECLLR